MYRNKIDVERNKELLLFEIIFLKEFQIYKELQELEYLE